MGAILRMAQPEMAPRRHVRRRSVPATFHHDVPSQDPALDQIGAKEQHIKSSTQSDDGKCLKSWATFVKNNDNNDDDGHDFFRVKT